MKKVYRSILFRFINIRYNANPLSSKTIYVNEPCAIKDRFYQTDWGIANLTVNIDDEKNIDLPLKLS